MIEAPLNCFKNKLADGSQFSEGPTSSFALFPRRYCGVFRHGLSKEVESRASAVGYPHHSRHPPSQDPTSQYFEFECLEEVKTGTFGLRRFGAFDLLLITHLTVLLGSIRHRMRLIDGEQDLHAGKLDCLPNLRSKAQSDRNSTSYASKRLKGRTLVLAHSRLPSPLGSPSQNTFYQHFKGAKTGRLAQGHYGLSPPSRPLQPPFQNNSDSVLGG